MSYSLSPRERILWVVSNLVHALQEGSWKEVLSFLQILEHDWKAFQEDRLEPLAICATSAKPPRYAKDLEPEGGWWFVK